MTLAMDWARSSIGTTAICSADAGLPCGKGWAVMPAAPPFNPVSYSNLSSKSDAATKLADHSASAKARSADPLQKPKP